MVKRARKTLGLALRPLRKIKKIGTLLPIKWRVRLLRIYKRLPLKKIEGFFRPSGSWHWPRLAATALAVFLVSFLAIHFYHLAHRYDLSAKEKTLLSKTSVDLKYVKDSKESISYNAQQQAAAPGDRQLTVSGAADSTGQMLYKATISKKASAGMTFGDGQGNFSLKMVPLDSLSPGRYLDNGHTVFAGAHGSHQVLTFKRNGVKEDILLSKPPGDSFSFSWKLELGSKLTAKMLPDGGVGIYSPDPTLFSSNLQISDAKSQALITKARANAKKDNLLFIIPAPYIKEANGKQTIDGLKFVLKDNVLTLSAANLKNKNYPLSIDPTVVVTTAADFATGYDDGNIDYTIADEIDRAGIGTGLAGAWSYTSNSANNGGTFSAGFTEPRQNAATVAYNGYLYLIGGTNPSNPASDCTIADGLSRYYCNGVQYAPINANGTIGAWHYTHSGVDDSTTYVAGFNTPRQGLTSVAYNGYLYVLGGFNSSVGGGDCVGGYCNGVQYAPINANGTIGAWNYTSNSANNGTTFSGGFAQPRYGHTSVAYNGYLYVIGGVNDGSVIDDCSAVYCNGVQYAPINANGTIGAWNYTHNSTNDGGTFSAGFTHGRYGHTSVAYNGYLYVIGGFSSLSTDDCSGASGYCNGVQYAPINANGTIGAWHYTSNSADNGTAFSAGFTKPRSGHTSVAYNGYLYVIGGTTAASGNDCSGVNPYFCNGVQYAPINANGTIGAWHYTHNSTDDSTTFSAGFTQGRNGHSSVAYNGYLYVIGGYEGSTANDCNVDCNGVQFASLTTLKVTTGPVGTWNYTSNSTNNGTTFSAGFIQPRYEHTSVAYNGYLYVIGGIAVASGNDCTGVSNPYYCNGVQFAPINANGTIGAWHYTHNSTDDSTTFVSGFITNRGNHTSVAYNGYLYIIGGKGDSATGDCNNFNNFCNGVQYAPINANGTIGAWHYTHNSTDDSTTFVAGFNQFRDQHSTAIYNGYLYIMGGESAFGGDCSYSGANCNGVQYAPINANGTIGAWHYTHNSTDDSTTFVAGFNQFRDQHSTAIYNGYLYIMGGESAFGGDCSYSGADCNGVQYAPINANGTIGAWNYTSNSANNGTTFVAGFITPRFAFTSAAYNGYIYIIGGYATNSGSDCTSQDASNWYHCNGVQYAPINANGTIGTWHYTHDGADDGTTFVAGFTGPRGYHDSAVYNGRLYIIGGLSSISTGDCTTGASSPYYCNGVQYAPINANGTIGTWNYTHSSVNDGSIFVAGFNQERRALSSVAYNGYLYVMGGDPGLNTTKDCTTSLCNGVQFASISAGTQPSLGTDGTWNYTSSSANNGATFSAGFTQPRYFDTSVAYNGYLYVIGGLAGTSGNDCTTSTGPYFCNGVQFAKINSDGTIGAWNYTSNSANNGTTFVAGFTNPRSEHTSVAYNGYMYVIGGNSPSGGSDCSGYCNGVQFAPINSDGTIGAWHYTHNGTDDSTTFVSGFTKVRRGLTSVAYNGYLYVIGGLSTSATNDCSATNICNGVQYAPINANGTIGAWNYTSNSANNGTTFVSGFIQARYDHTSVAYNGYLYVMGGQSGTSANDCTGASNNCNGVQFAKINSDGTIGAWNYTSNSANNGTTFVAGFTQPRYSHTSVAYNGYVYVMGGASGAGSDCNSFCNGVQFAKINSDGTIGPWNYTSNSTNNGATFSAGFTNSRYGHTSIAYNGYVYVIGGFSGTNANDCTTGTTNRYCNGVQYASLNSLAHAATYEKAVDVGGAYKITSLSFNGQAVCGMQINYRVGNASGSFGSVTSIASGIKSTIYSINQTGRYLWVQFKMNDAACGTQSQITDFTVTYNTPPTNVFENSPVNVTGVSETPTFQVVATDTDGDYLRYKIDVCSDFDCTTIVRTIDQTSSQTGWSGQDQQGGTAYSSSTTATYTYQLPPLSKNTQYWWDVAAIDPGGSNTWTVGGAPHTFTTGDDVPPAPTLIYPVNSSSGNSVYTTFQLRSTDLDSDYLEYWIDVCGDGSCSSIIRRICQYTGGSNLPSSDGKGTCSASQTGWAGQDRQTGTAYGGNPSLTMSSLASHNYQAPLLSANSTYWWRAYAIDPGGSNTWSSPSAVQSFVTAPTETHIQGNVMIKGNVKL